MKKMRTIATFLAKYVFHQHKTEQCMSL